jgi:high-affinity K+ transport system ATPase subunit B
MRYVCAIIIVLFVLTLFASLHNAMNEARRQAAFQATLKKLSKFNYEFVIHNGQDEWDTYVLQLEASIGERPQIYEKFYLNECKKIPSPPKNLP